MAEPALHAPLPTDATESARSFTGRAEPALEVADFVDRRELSWLVAVDACPFDHLPRLPRLRRWTNRIANPMTMKSSRTRAATITTTCAEFNVSPPR